MWHLLDSVQIKQVQTKSGLPVRYMNLTEDTDVLDYLKGGSIFFYTKLKKLS